MRKGFSIIFTFILIFSSFIPHFVYGAEYDLSVSNWRFTCFHKWCEGGALSLFGIIFEISAFFLFSGVSPKIIILAGPGYYAALAGSLTAISSRWAGQL